MIVYIVYIERYLLGVMKYQYLTQSKKALGMDVPHWPEYSVCFHVRAFHVYLLHIFMYIYYAHALPAQWTGYSSGCSVSMTIQCPFPRSARTENLTHYILRSRFMVRFIASFVESRGNLTTRVNKNKFLPRPRIIRTK